VIFGKKLDIEKFPIYIEIVRRLRLQEVEGQKKGTRW
jgi:hypothetical protein